MTVRLLIGDCRERLAEIEAGSVDSCVTDPPYHLTNSARRVPPPEVEGSPFSRHRMGVNGDPKASRGFMGQEWDGGDVAFQRATWESVFRVLKPGAHCIAFSGTRTYHRMVCAIEDAGFEIRDQLAWIYGSGFPKSHDVAKGIDKIRDDRADILRVTSFVADSAERSGFARADIDAFMGTSDMAGWWTSRLLHRCQCPKWEQWLQLKLFLSLNDEMDAEVWRLNGRKGQPGEAWNEREVIGRATDGAANGSVVGLGSAGTLAREYDLTAPARPEAEQWEGWGTALKPAWEPICLARKPLVGTVAANVLQHGTGALNIDGCRIEGAGPSLHGGKRTTPLHGGGQQTEREDYSESPHGRWPANIIHDGSEEVLAGFPDAAVAYSAKATASGGKIFQRGEKTIERHDMGGGSAARFFYCAKATSAERGEGNGHPTVKPVDLMRWLVRLVTPKGGTVLDPFAGSGSTLIAADAEQFNAIGCELSPEYAAIAEKRVRASAGMFAEVLAA